jgi:hypothetical protein
VAESYTVGAGWITAAESPGIRRHYQPLAETELYVDFARLGSHGQPQDSSVRRWSEKYGLLTGLPSRERGSLEPEDFLAPVERDREKRNRVRESRHAEILEHSMKLQDFRRESRTVSQLLGLYHDLRARDGGAVLEVFTSPLPAWPDTPVTIVDRHLRAYRDRDYRREVEGYGLDLEHHHIRLAHDLLQRCVNLKLRELDLRPSMGWNFWDVPTKRSASLGFELRWSPPDLLAAIYLQLFHLFTDQAATRRCDWCGTPYPLTRKDRRWCDGNCRSAGRAKKSPADTTLTPP